MRSSMISISFILLLTFLIPFSTSSQANAEKQAAWKKLAESKNDTTRVLALLDYGGLFAFENYDTAEFYYRQARDLSLKKNFYRGYQKYISYQSEIFNLKGMFDSNIVICRKGLALAEQRKDALFMGTHLNNIGNVFLYKANNDSAAWYFLKAGQYFESSKDSMRLGQLYSNLSIVFDNLGQYQQSLMYNRLALQIARNINDELSVGYSMTNIGTVLKRQSIYDSAKYYLESALPIAKKFGDLNLEKDIVVDLGFISLKKKNIIKAEAYFQRSLFLSQHLKNDYGIVFSNKGLANIRIEQKKFAEGERLLVDAIAIATDKKFKEELQDLYLLQYDAANSSGNFKAALDAYRNYIIIKDSLVSLEVQKNIALLEKQYQAERRERLMLQKDEEIRNQQIQLQSKNTWLIILSVLMTLLGAIAFLIWKSYKQKRIADAKEQKLLQVQLSMQVKEEERNRIARELHDDLGGSLSGIVMHTHFMVEQVEGNNAQEVRKSINKIHSAASEMITRLNDIVWLINPKYDTLEKLVQRIEEFAIDITKAKGMEVRINTPIVIESVALDMQARKNIYLICKEAINNAIKYSNASELILTISRSGEDLTMRIEDNGKGFDKDLTKKGNGLLNMKERAKDIGAVYSLNTMSSKGTRIQLDYKIPQ